jgi:hypothetical protein
VRDWADLVAPAIRKCHTSDITSLRTALRRGERLLVVATASDKKSRSGLIVVTEERPPGPFAVRLHEHDDRGRRDGVVVEAGAYLEVEHLSMVGVGPE